MTVKHFKMKVRNAAGYEFEETYTKEVEDIEAWAKETIESYNASLKRGETARELISVTLIDEWEPEEEDDEEELEDELDEDE